jgi:TolB protein
MKKLIYLFAILLIFAAVGRAQDIKDYSARLDAKSGFEKVRLAVEDFTPRAGTRMLVSDSMALVRLAEIIRDDLNFSPFYEVIPLDSFYMRHMEMEVMSLLGWSQLGAEYVVRGEGEFAGDEIIFKYEMYVAKSGMLFAHGQFRSIITNYRRLAHQVANDIILYLTGDRGIFDTRICFISDRTGNKELYLCDFDGANVYQLTGNGSINLSPTFDPDGQEILFTSFMNGDPQLYQYDIRNGKVELLAGYPGINSAARVSPDGKTIVCALSRDGNAEIYLLQRSGKIKRRLTYTAAIESGPCWSPNGRQIAFTSDRSGTPQLYVMDADGVNVRRLTYVGNYNDSPDWSPKGDKIVFLSRVDGRFNICTIDVTGDNFRVLTEMGNNENPHWAPDGNEIVFSSTRTGEKEIFVMDLFGNEEKRLTTGGGNSNPAWSDFPK